jgi:hypothetical protein
MSNPTELLHQAMIFDSFVGADENITQCSIHHRCDGVQPPCKILQHQNATYASFKKAKENHVGNDTMPAMETLI